MWVEVWSKAGFNENYGGETGIRTLDTLRYTRFPSVRLQPLGHLSAPWNLFEANTFEQPATRSLPARRELGCLRFDGLLAVAGSGQVERQSFHQESA